MKPILQIALDLTDLFKTIELATKITSTLGCSDLWIEAGTPLIKSWGRVAVKTLKDLTKCFIVADTKTMDTGGLEAELFFKAGANAVTVLGVADDTTIIEARDKAREYNGKLIVDLINHPKPLERAIELDKLDVDIILYHVGIDVQRKRGMTAVDLLNELRELKKNVSSMIAVAGGIKHGEASKFVEVGVDVIIVGSAITKSSNPIDSTKRFLEEIKMG